MAMAAVTGEAQDMNEEIQSLPLRVCIAGAGAIGCTLAAMLVRSGQPVSMLARGETLKAIQRKGIHFTDQDGAHTVQVIARAAADFGTQDVVFLCTKAPALPLVLPQLAPAIGPGTCVVPMVNGVPWWYFQGEEGRFARRHVDSVDPGGTLLSLLNPAQIVGAAVFITAERTAPATARSTNRKLVYLGELDNRPSLRASRICAMLEAAGIAARVADRIRDQLWTKLIANLTSNPLSAITGATLERIYTDPLLAPIARKILDETLLTAAAFGARIAFDPETIMRMGVGMGAVRTSMLQDLEQGAPLELAAIGEAVLELAALQGIAMPVTRDILALARFRGNAAHTAGRRSASHPFA
jgi:2-dehydropantoate 2-reductase